MAKVTRADLLSQDPGEGAPIVEALAPLATGVNEDGTSFSVLTSGLANKFRDEFMGGLGAWDQYTANGASITTTGSVVRLSTGASAGAVAELTSKATYAPGVRLYAVLAALSQRVANQEFTISLVEETTGNDATGTDRAEWRFTGTTAQTGTVQAWSQGDAATAQSQTSLVSTAGASVFEIDLGHEEAWFYNTPADSTSARSASNRISRKVPDPNKRYKVRLRATNTAAASNTNFDIDSILVEDYAFFPIEIVRSRGGSTAGESQPVNITSSSTVPTSSQPTASTTGALLQSHKRAGNDGALVQAKGSAGRVYGAKFVNVGAATRYLKLFNSSAATLGTTTPFAAFPIPAGQSFDLDLQGIGVGCSSGIAYAITTGAADLDTALSPAGEVMGGLFYV